MSTKNSAFPPKRVLITGGSGYIGSRLVQQLVQLDWAVHLIVRPSSQLGALDRIKNQITCHNYDGQIDSLMQIMQAVQPEIVFHLASLFLPQHQPSDVDRLIQSNVQFGTQLLEVMREKGVKQIVNTGTSWQHHLNISDRATNLYAATKQAFERILDYYTEAHQFAAVTLYVFDSYGPNDPRKKLISLLWANAQGQTTLEMSPGEQLIDLVHVDDLVRAFVVATQEQTLKPGQHNRFGLSSGRAMPLKALAELFSTSCGVALKINWGGRPYRDREVMKTWTTHTPLPNWAPEISLEQGLPRSAP